MAGICKGTGQRCHPRFLRNNDNGESLSPIVPGGRLGFLYRGVPFTVPYGECRKRDAPRMLSGNDRL